MSSFELVELPHHGDNRGDLTVFEDALPFQVKRVFWITGAEGQTRGGHRHKATRQGIVALAGQVDVYMDNGQDFGTIRLDSPHQCLLVEPEDWHTMQFGQGSILLVLASHTYDRADYIEASYR